MKVVKMWRMMGKAAANSKGQVIAKTDHWKIPAAPNDSSKSRSNPDISSPEFHFTLIWRNAVMQSEPINRCARASMVM